LDENYRSDVLFVWTSARVRVYPVDAVLPADGFLPSTNAVKTASARTWGVRVSAPRPRGHGSARTRGRASARTHVDTRRAATGPRGRGAAFSRTRGHGVAEFRVSPIKEGALLLSLTSIQIRLNSWGLKRCVYTSFFLDRIVGILVGNPLQMRGEVLLFCRIFRSCWFEDVGSRGYLRGPEGKINFKW
jgi:hypothetical protein